ncbi:RNA polymerase factor sigma-54 [Paenibacillus azoreducens]|uniref:RNA polymerase sigma-54 factor n=1 Tax=Paenibacillus azoreducens TaxID=116718 RepID=A0A919YC19_9BACL|nr:RNA polymerase factor sigma-54 [Paenibacillus azoreducens]GIO46250.1 RNA polymerase sigma-54 factor [Paenibacillus azoreducens]
MLGYQLVQDQRLKLALTPELKQSIHILSLPADELIQYLHEQATENPVLELEDGWEARAYSGRIRRGEGMRLERDPLWNAAGTQDTMEEKLKSQLRLLSLPAEVYRAAAYMAGNLNDDGYLDIPLTEIRSMLNVSEAVLMAALESLQSLEPAGIAGRDLRECLLLQIARDPDSVPFAYEIVDNYLPELAHGNLERITSDLRISKEQATSASRYIRSLNPRPGLAMGAFNRQFIVPDAVVERHGDGFTVSLLSSNVPKLSISDEWRNWIKMRKPAEEGLQLNTCYKSAEWLVRSVEMRKLTLTRVVCAIMEEQQAFLSEGAKGLRPMTLNTISGKLDMHESTVSRAVHGKYVLTPYGVFPLKYFFAAGLSTSDGGGVSSRTVQAKIKELIDSEDKRYPYSDQKIADMLLAEGIRLSRRTVTKYREELRILSSSARRDRK